MRSGSRRSLGPCGPRHAALTRLTRSSTPSPSVSVSGSPSILGRAARKCSLLVTRPRPGRPDGHQGRHPAVDLGVERVAEPQLEAGAERVAHGRAEVGPAAARHQQVEAEREAAAGQLLQVQLDVVEVGAQRAPAVDDEVHVAVPVVDPALRLAGSGRSRSSRCPAPGSTPRGGRRCRSPRRRSGGRRRAPTGCRRRRRGAARPSARRRRRRSPSRRTATPAGSSSARGW